MFLVANKKMRSEGLALRFGEGSKIIYARGLYNPIGYFEPDDAEIMNSTKLITHEDKVIELGNKLYEILEALPNGTLQTTPDDYINESGNVIDVNAEITSTNLNGVVYVEFKGPYQPPLID